MNVQMSSIPPASASVATTVTAAVGDAAAPQRQGRAAPAVTVPAGTTAAVSEQELQTVVNDIQQRVQPVASGLRFSVDKASDHLVVQVVDESTLKVLRQFPSEEFLKMAKDIDRMQGLLIRDKA